jgi:hypothetical protein
VTTLVLGLCACVASRRARTPFTHASLGEGLEEIVSIQVGKIDVLPAIAAAHHMIDRGQIFNADLRRHGTSFPKGTFLIPFSSSAMRPYGTMQ